MLGRGALGGPSVHHIISEMSHREPRAIAVDVMQTHTLDLTFLTQECFKASEEIIRNMEKTQATLVLVTFQ